MSLSKLTNICICLTVEKALPLSLPKKFLKLVVPGILQLPDEGWFDFKE